MKKDIKKIAIVRLSALGDIINSAVVLQFLHQQYPDVKIDWLTEEVFAPILQNHPLLNKVQTINLKSLKKNKSFKQLKDTIITLRALGEYDKVIDMQGLIKSAIVSRIISSNTHGFDKDSTRESFASYFYKTTSHIDYGENVIKRNCFVVSDALGFEINKEMILTKTPIFPYSKMILGYKNKNKKNIALVIGASWESKKYPKEKVADICNELRQNCHIIWGNELEKESALWICDNSPFAKPAPKLSLTELVSFVSSCDLLIGGDTGPTHLAWAQNIPSITLLGPTTTRMIYETPINIGIKSPSIVDINKIDKNDFSIKDIEVKDIVKKAMELLNHGI